MSSYLFTYLMCVRVCVRVRAPFLYKMQHKELHNIKTIKNLPTPPKHGQVITLTKTTDKELVISQQF